MRSLLFSLLLLGVLAGPGLALDLPRPVGNYQAYAINPSTGAFGFALGYDSQSAAMRAARNGCGGDVCRMSYNAQGYCSALFVAETASGRRYGAHWGNTRADAERYAANQCKRFTGQTCRKVHSDCVNP